jgi:hypothetical protein
MLRYTSRGGVVSQLNVSASVRRVGGRLASLALLCVLVALPSAAFAAWPSTIPSLPPPSGAVVNVSTEAQLQSAIKALTSGTTIVVAPGTYNLSNTLWIRGPLTNVGLRGATSNAADVVFVGKGMSNASYGNVPHGIWTGDGVTGVTIANLTVKNVYYHPIALNPGTESPRIYNVHLIDAGEQFIKASSSPNGGTDNGVVEYSRFEYTSTARSDYTNGIDVHQGKNWVIRNNYFKNIKGPQGTLAGPVILMWNTAGNTLLDGNTFINCQREVAFGLIQRSPNDHSGGIIRNNFIYRVAGTNGDTPIGVFDSPGTVVVHNTIIISGDHAYSIEYRWADTSGVYIANNLADAPIRSRDGGTGTVTSNYTTATASMFVNPAAGDLHLKSTATAAIDKGIAIANHPLDFDAGQRPSGSAADIGADEYGGSTSTAPAAPTNLRILR